MSHVSKQLAALEASLGVKLVQRTTRSFTLTDAGNLFYAQCRELLTIVTNAQSEMEDQRDEVVGLIRLGLSQSFGTLHVLPALEQLRQQYPELNVEVHLFDHKVDMLKEGWIYGSPVTSSYQRVMWRSALPIAVLWWPHRQTTCCVMDHPQNLWP